MKNVVSILKITDRNRAHSLGKMEIKRFQLHEVVNEHIEQATLEDAKSNHHLRENQDLEKESNIKKASLNHSWMEKKMRKTMGTKPREEEAYHGSGWIEEQT